MISAYGDNLVFLIGAPRSGTTLLSVLLSKVPEIYCPPERWIALAVQRLVAEPSEEWKPEGDAYLTGVALNSALSREERRGMARIFLNSAYNWWLKQDHVASIFIDKTPRYYKILPFLGEIFPNARFVFIVRNPLDVAGSHKVRWNVNLGSLFPSEAWDTAFDVFSSPSMMADVTQEFASRSHRLSYEALVADPEAALRGVLDFLQVPYRDEYLHDNQWSARLEEQRASVLGDKVIWTRRDIGTESVESWKTRLDDDEAALVAGIVGREAFGRLGYSYPETAADRPLQRAYLLEKLKAHTQHWPSTDEGDPGGHAPVRDFPLISIVTPSFNQGCWIEETIRSVEFQDYPRFEHIIVDGGSRDETADIVAKHPHLRFIQGEDAGQSHAINKGILASSGEVIAYINSDDVYCPGAFRQAVDALKKADTVGIVLGSVDRVSDLGEALGHLRAKYGDYRELQRYWRWDQTYCIPQQAAFWRRSVTEEVGLFDTACHYSMDYDMWMRMLARYQPIVLETTLAQFRFHEESKTVSQADSMYLEHLHVARRYWPPVWRPQRWSLELVGARITGRGLLDVGEHVALSDMDKRRALPILGRAARYWPLFVISPRWILSVLTASSASLGAKPAMVWVHREYLSARYRAKMLVRGLLRKLSPRT